MPLAKHLSFPFTANLMNVYRTKIKYAPADSELSFSPFCFLFWTTFRIGIDLKSAEVS